MKGNVFSIWLKELCALVFTQTVQAFILAIILTLIVMTYTQKSVGGLATNVQTQATGVLAIIALTSISKMENLVKKIFGLESSITDTSMRGGRGSIMGSIAAMKMAKNVLNNVPKMGQGLSDWRKGGREKRQAKLDAYDKLMRLDKRYGSSNSNVTNGHSTESSNNVNHASSSPTVDAAQARLDEVIAEGFEAGDSEYDNALKDLNNAKNNSNSLTPSTKYSTKSNNINNDKYLDKKEKIMEEYNKRLSEAKELRRGSYKKIVSGALETVKATQGAAVGLTAGAVIAAGTGEDILSYATKGAGIGMGVGDKIGKGMTDVAFAPRDITKATSNFIKVYKKESRDKRKEFEDELKKFNAGDI